MKQLLLLLISSVLISSNSCEGPPGADVVYSILMRNQTNKALSFVVSYNYADTLIPSDYNDVKGIPSNDEVYIDRRIKWEVVFEEDLPNDTLSIFLFDTLINEENWDQIRSNYGILKRYDLSLQDLTRLDFTITYPPGKDMEGVKMWPPE